MKLPSLNKTFTYVILGTLAFLGFVLIISATQKNSSKRCNGIDIIIKDSSEQLLVTRQDVEKWITDNGNEPVEGKIIENVDLTKIEKRVNQNGYTKTCQAYTNLQGDLIVEVEAYKPIARVLGNGGLSDKYLDFNGTFFPVSMHFSPNVTLISGEYFTTIKNLKSEKNLDLLKLLQKISEDDFLEAQIVQLDVDLNKEISMVPLLGNFTIEFGKPENVESKFKKLMVFYKRILPQKEWEGISKISVKYDGQIVCN
jgi:cell division protein FtsQ